MDAIEQGHRRDSSGAEPGRRPDLVSGRPTGDLGEARRVLAAFMRRAAVGLGASREPLVTGAWIVSEGVVAATYFSAFVPEQHEGLISAFPPHFHDDDPVSTGEGMYLNMCEPLGSCRVLWLGDTRWHGDLDQAAWTRAEIGRCKTNV